MDDEPALRRLLFDLLAGEGYVVRQAADGAQALQKLHEFQPDLVLVDMMMPVMDGLEFVTACRHIAGYADLPVILMSAMYDIAREAGGRTGAAITAYLGKPFSVQDLLALVELHASRAAAQPLSPRGSMPPPGGPIRVLVVLDQAIMAGVARLTLNHGVYQTRTVTDTAAAAAALAEWQPSLMLLDMALADATLVPQIRAVQPGSTRLPVIGLTRRGDLASTLAAFEAGAEDFLSLPFAPDELLARVVGVLRRSYTDVVAFTPIVEIGDLQIDILNRTARMHTSELHLTSLEQNLLYLLAASDGRVVSRKEISQGLWDAESVTERNTVDRQVRNLRARLLNISGRRDFIASVPGRGYRFSPAVASGTT